MFHLIGIGGVEYSLIFILSLLGFKMYFRLFFSSSSHVSESVNNSIFHQIAEQLQQQNLEHLRQQLLEQQQPQKVYNSILWSLELLLPVFCKMLFLKDGGFSSTLLQDQPFQNLYIFCYQNVFWIYACARYTRGGVLILQLETSRAFLSAQFPIKQGHDDFASVDCGDGKIDCYF